MSRTAPVAAFVRSLSFEEIPEATVATVKALLLDTLGVAAAASRGAMRGIAGGFAAASFAAGDPAEAASILFDGRRVSRPGAVYAGAATIDNLEAHDGHRRTKGHVGVAVVPALLAFAEGRGLGGREALTALVLGYEIGTRAGIALHAQAAEYHNSGAWNGLGVAAVGARLRGLDEGRIAASLGIAEFHGARGLAMRGVDHPSMLGDGSGWGALAGAAACLLAEAGHTAAPADLVEHEAGAAAWDDLGRTWLTDQQYIKLHTICGFGAAPIDAAAALRARHDLDPAAIRAIEIGSFGETRRLDGGMPANPNVAQFRIPFGVAAMLARGRHGPEETAGSGLADPEIARLVGVTTMVARPDYDARLPVRWADVSVTLADGRVLSSGEVNARGGPDAPASAAEWRAKYRAYAGLALSPDRVAAIEAAVDWLDEPGAVFDALLALVRPPPDGQ